jgi:hypothetical protein
VTFRGGELLTAARPDARLGCGWVEETVDSQLTLNDGPDAIELTLMQFEQLQPQIAADQAPGADGIEVARLLSRQRPLRNEWLR